MQPSAGPRRVQRGKATSDVVLSAHVGGNAEVFPQVLALHVPRGARVADVTHGRGVFWRLVEPDAYRVAATDLATGVDCRALPYPDSSFDALVLDPPYMEGLHRRSASHMAGVGTHAAFRDRYSDGVPSAGAPRYHDAVLDLYRQAGAEAHRVLRPGGVFIVKCQDEVSANRQRLTHVELINHFERHGFRTKDLFVVVRPNRPAVSRLLRQVHARKNHSYFLVLVRRPGDAAVAPAAGRD